MKKNKGKTVTFRLDAELHKKCVDLTIKKSIKENRIVKISETIRNMIIKGLDNE